MAEQALRESEERFRIIANNASIPMWVSALRMARDYEKQYRKLASAAFKDGVDAQSVTPNFYEPLRADAGDAISGSAEEIG